MRWLAAEQAVHSASEGPAQAEQVEWQAAQTDCPLSKEPESQGQLAVASSRVRPVAQAVHVLAVAQAWQL